MQSHQPPTNNYYETSGVIHAILYGIGIATGTMIGAKAGGRIGNKIGGFIGEGEGFGAGIGFLMGSVDAIAFFGKTVSGGNIFPVFEHAGFIGAPIDATEIIASLGEAGGTLVGVGFGAYAAITVCNLVIL